MGFSFAICRHCHKCKVNRPRGLCWSCYYTPGVRELYPSTSKYARRGVGMAGNSALPEHPVFVDPGSPEKEALMHERAKAGLSLFHPAEPRFSAEYQQDWTVPEVSDPFIHYREDNADFYSPAGAGGDFDDGTAPQGLPRYPAGRPPL